MTSIKVWIALIVALLLASCASLPVKERVVRTVQSAHAAAANAQDAEISAWNAGEIPNYTVLDHQAFHAALADYFTAELALNQALLAWEASDAPPESLGDAISAIQNAVDVVSMLAPDGPMATTLEYARVVLRFLLGLQAEMGGTA